MITPATNEALTQIAAAFDAAPLEIREDSAGGAFVVVPQIDLGPAFAPRYSWIGFQISSMYPRADVYPHWVVPELSRRDGIPVTPPLNPRQTMPGFNRAATMVSRRSHRWNPATDTALLKLLRVQKWFLDQSSDLVAA